MAGGTGHTAGRCDRMVGAVRGVADGFSGVVGGRDRTAGSADHTVTGGSGTVGRFGHAVGAGAMWWNESAGQRHPPTVRLAVAAVREKFPAVSESSSAAWRKHQASRCRNSAHAFATSGALRMADTTQILFAPAANTASRVCKLIPPMANHGMLTFAAAQRT